MNVPCRAVLSRLLRWSSHPPTDTPSPPCPSASQQALADAGLEASQVANVEVVGGTTRVPAVQRALTEFFGREPSRTLNAKETVSRGCALQVNKRALPADCACGCLPATARGLDADQPRLPAPPSPAPSLSCSARC